MAYSTWNSRPSGLQAGQQNGAPVKATSGGGGGAAAVAGRAAPRSRAAPSSLVLAACQRDQSATASSRPAITSFPALPASPARLNVFTPRSYSLRVRNMTLQAAGRALGRQGAALGHHRSQEIGAAVAEIDRRHWASAPPGPMLPAPPPACCAPTAVRLPCPCLAAVVRSAQVVPISAIEPHLFLLSC